MESSNLNNLTPRYVLVHWVGTSFTSILTDDFVTDKSLLTDNKKQGLVLFGIPGRKPPERNGWTPFLARVEAVSFDKKALISRQMQLEPQIWSRVTPQMDSEGEHQNLTTKKLFWTEEDMKKTKEQVAQLEWQVKEMEQEMNILRQEKAKLQSLNYRLQEGLPSLVKTTITGCFNKQRTAANGAIPSESPKISKGKSKAPQSPRPAQPPKKIAPSILVGAAKNSQPVNRSTNSGPTQVLNVGNRPLQPKVNAAKISIVAADPPIYITPDSTKDTEMEIVYEMSPADVLYGQQQYREAGEIIDYAWHPPSGAGIHEEGFGHRHNKISCFVSNERYQQLSADTAIVPWTRMTCAVMNDLFTREEMATSSVSGKGRSNNFYHLHEGKSAAVVDFITEHYSLVTATNVRNKMAQKCKDERLSVSSRGTGQNDVSLLNTVLALDSSMQ